MLLSMIKEQRNVIFAVVITILFCGCVYFATNTTTYLSTMSTQEPVEISTIHPFTHCLQVTMSESRQSGHPCSIKEAKSICHGLQEPANYKGKNGAEDKVE
jgi:hypothetical protein